jgi:hypothetical protein
MLYEHSRVVTSSAAETFFKDPQKPQTCLSAIEKHNAIISLKNKETLLINIPKHKNNFTQQNTFSNQKQKEQPKNKLTNIF